MEKPNRVSWIDPRLYVQSSPIAGQGVFASKAIAKEELVVLLGGLLFSAADIRAGKARENSEVAVDENTFIGGRLGETALVDEYINHSCNPNTAMKGRYGLVARSNISAGEELTADYAMWECEEDFVLFPECRCNDVLCRGRITGSDWRLSTLQVAYQNHWPPFIKKRIALLSPLQGAGK